MQSFCLRFIKQVAGSLVIMVRTMKRTSDSMTNGEDGQHQSRVRARHTVLAKSMSLLCANRMELRRSHVEQSQHDRMFHSDAREQRFRGPNFAIERRLWEREYLGMNKPLSMLRCCVAWRVWATRCPRTLVGRKPGHPKNVVTCQQSRRALTGNRLAEV